MQSQIKAGNIFNMEASRKVLSNMNSLQLFQNMEVNPRMDEALEQGVVIEVKLREMEPQQNEVSFEWSIAPGDTGKPTLVRPRLAHPSSPFRPPF